MELKRRLSLFILLILILAVFSAAAYAGKERIDLLHRQKAMLPA